MADKIQQTLDGVSKTLLMTLYVRARESQHAAGMICDDLAVDMVNRLDCDFSHLRMHRHDEIAVIMRMKKFDQYVRDFLAKNQKAAVVHIGCGLDTRFQRVDNGQVEWFDLDMPDVIELRKRLQIPIGDRYHMLSTSVFDDDWFEDVEPYRTRPLMFIAEGVLPYFDETSVKSLFIRLLERFPGSELVCDAHTAFVKWADNLQLAISGIEARLRWSIKAGMDPEQWCMGIKLLDEWNYYEDDEPSLKSFRWVRMFPALAKSSGIFHYRLG